MIFSAGLGNLIEEFLKSENKLTNNIHIISNFFKFDKNGKSISYTHPLVHSLNKSEIQLKHHAYQNGLPHPF